VGTLGVPETALSPLMLWCMGKTPRCAQGVRTVQSGRVTSGIEHYSLKMRSAFPEKSAICSASE
jgi:hypothetical protein